MLQRAFQQKSFPKFTHRQPCIWLILYWSKLNARNRLYSLQCSHFLIQFYRNYRCYSVEILMCQLYLCYAIYHNADKCIVLTVSKCIAYLKCNVCFSEYRVINRLLLVLKGHRLGYSFGELVSLSWLQVRLFNFV